MQRRKGQASCTRAQQSSGAECHVIFLTENFLFWLYLEIWRQPLADRLRNPLLRAPPPPPHTSSSKSSHYFVHLVQHLVSRWRSTSLPACKRMVDFTKANQPNSSCFSCSGTEIIDTSRRLESCCHSKICHVEHLTIGLSLPSTDS